MWKNKECIQNFGRKLLEDVQFENRRRWKDWGDGPCGLEADGVGFGTY
jgi:hypothetical protein